MLRSRTPKQASKPNKPTAKVHKTHHNAPKRHIATSSTVKRHNVSHKNITLKTSMMSSLSMMSSSLNQSYILPKSIRSHSTVSSEGSDPAFASQRKPTPQQQSMTEEEEDDIMEQIDQIVKANKIMLFMKGTPSSPKCGFSMRVVQVLNHLNVQYEACDVLASAELREAIKQYSDWSTIPQLFINGEFVGGCDIVTEMYQKGELQEMLGLPKTQDKQEQQKQQV